MVVFKKKKKRETFFSTKGSSQCAIPQGSIIHRREDRFCLKSIEHRVSCAFINHILNSNHIYIYNIPPVRTHRRHRLLCVTRSLRGLEKHAFGDTHKSSAACVWFFFFEHIILYILLLFIKQCCIRAHSFFFFPLTSAFIRTIIFFRKDYGTLFVQE